MRLSCTDTPHGPNRAPRKDLKRFAKRHNTQESYSPKELREEARLRGAAGRAALQ